MTKLKIKNISDRPTIIDFNPKGIKRLVLLPDNSPINGSLPVGSILVYEKENHKINPDHLGQDAGCGMLLGIIKNFSMDRMGEIVNDVAAEILSSGNRDRLGYLGSGNHFITLYKVNESKEPLLHSKDTLILIHSGSGRKGIDLYKNGLENTATYLENYENVCGYARRNRKELLEIFKKYSKSEVKIILDNVHNSIEASNDEIIYRKGAVRARPGEHSIISSSMSGDAVIVNLKESVAELEYSIPHGTGRKMSRSEAHGRMFFLKGFPNNIYVPYFLSAENLNTELPPCYRTLEEILPSIEHYIDIMARLSPIAAIMA